MLLQFVAQLINTRSALRRNLLMALLERFYLR
jgi:hypothetical protein